MTGGTVKERKENAAISEIDQYLFDSQGYLVVENILSEAEIQRLIAALPRKTDGDILQDDDHPDDAILQYDEPLYRELINHPKILPYLEHFLTPCDFAEHWGHNQIYLNHAHHFVLKRGGWLGTWFHNGNVPYKPTISYVVREEKIYANFIGVIWCLTEVLPELGGFWCIPGSHKANFPLPRDIQEYKHIVECAHQPAVSAGSAIIFTEALTHGTKVWQADHERVALIYKYVSNYLPLLRPMTQEAIDLMTPEQLKYVTFPDGRFVRAEDVEI